MEQAYKKAEATGGISFLGLYLGNLNANLLGIIIILALNFCTPLEFFKTTRVLILTQGEWKIFLFLIPLILLLLGYAQYRVQRPIRNLAALISRGNRIPEDMAQKGKQRLLNLPYIILLTTLAFIQWETRGSSLPAAELAREIFIFSLVLCGIFIVIALSRRSLMFPSRTATMQKMRSVQPSK